MLSVLVTVSGLLTIIFFPEPLFAHRLDHGNFSVYSNIKPDNRIGAILDNAMALVKDSELYDHAYTYDIFFSYDSPFNRIDDTLLGSGPSARVTDNNIVIKVPVNIERDLFFPAFYQKCEGSLSYLIAHEMMHCLQQHKYGKLKFNPFRHPELWKLEGYPEYIARSKMRSAAGYSLADEIEKYIDRKNKS